MTAPTLKQSLGAEIRRRRESKRLTPEEAAERAGVSAIAWRKWESGERWPGAEYLEAVAKVLNCRPSALFP